MTNAQYALIRKDLRVVVTRAQMWLPMVILPIMLAVFLPSVFMVVAYLSPEDSADLQEIRKIADQVPGLVLPPDPRQAILFFGLNQVFPGLFLLIPVMATSILAAGALVSEKEQNTLESLLYTPITIRQLFVAKLLGSLIPALVITFTSFALFLGIALGGQLALFGTAYLPWGQWLTMVFWLSPAIALCALGLAVIISARSKTYQESQQLTSLVVIPMILMVVAQSVGLFMLSPWLVLAAGAGLYGLAWVLIRMSARRFRPERLI